MEEGERQRVNNEKRRKEKQRIILFTRPFSYYEKESQSNDALLPFVEFSNVLNSDRSSNATRSNLVHKKCIKITLDPGSFAE